MLQSYPGIAVETDRHGTVTVMSSTNNPLNGLSPEKCLVQPLEQFVEDADRPALRSLLLSCCQGASGHALLHLRTGQSDHRAISALMHPAYGEDGSIIGTSGWWYESAAA